MTPRSVKSYKSNKSINRSFISKNSENILREKILMNIYNSLNK